jgi:tetrahydromethanopterin S-methyltransferase subunit C
MEESPLLLPALLVALGALDLTRCGLLLGSLHSSPGVPLVIAGVAAATACLLGARAYRRRQHWSSATALLIGLATAPLAAAAGFRAPFTVPDLASITLGTLVSVIVLSSGIRAGDPRALRR